MKKLFIPLFLLCVGIHTQLKAQSESSPAPKGAMFQFVGGDTYDFGNEVPLGPIAMHNFIFKNTGDQPLVIQDANPSCSCTSPEWPKHPVLPGQTDTLKVGYKTENHPGHFEKEVYIKSNATNPPNGRADRYVLYIKGSVVAAPPKTN